jgi:hypothetical protein
VLASRRLVPAHGALTSASDQGTRWQRPIPSEPHRVRYQRLRTRSGHCSPASLPRATPTFAVVLTVRTAPIGPCYSASIGLPRTGLGMGGQMRTCRLALRRREFNDPRQSLALRSLKRLRAWVGPMAAMCGSTFVGLAMTTIGTPTLAQELVGLQALTLSAKVFSHSARPSLTFSLTPETYASTQLRTNFCPAPEVDQPLRSSLRIRQLDEGHLSCARPGGTLSTATSRPSASEHRKAAGLAVAHNLASRGRS